MTYKAFLFLILWIGSILLREYALFSSVDELLALFILGVGIYNGALKSKTFVIVSVYFSVQLIYSLFLSYNLPIAIFQDFFMIARPYILVIIIGNGYFKLNLKDQAKILKYLYVLMFFLFINVVLTLIMGRSGTHAQSFAIYERNFSLAAVVYVVGLLILVLKKDYYFKKWDFPKILIFISLLCLIPLVRQGKYYGVIACFFASYFYASYIFPRYFDKEAMVRSFTKILSVFFAIFMIVGVFFLAQDKIELYYITDNENVARAMMVKALPQALEGNYFWLGRGFASYCTPITGKYYPPLLYELGLSSVFGLAPGAAYFIADAYFASWIAQTGFVGIVMYIFLMIYIIKPFYLLIKHKKMPGRILHLFIALFSWILIFSFGSGGMFGIGSFIMIILGFLRWRAVCLLNNHHDLKKEKTSHDIS